MALVLTAALLAAACGGDDGGGGSGTARGDSGSGEAAGETVKIGVAYPDLEAFATLNKKFSIGDPEKQAESVLEAWRRDGQLPVGGRDVEFVYRKYNIISDDQKLGLCKAFAQDDEVFAVIGGRDFTVGAECLADRFEIPVIDVNSAPAALYQRAPMLFTLRTDQTTLLRTFADWADENGYLKGKRIGLFFETRLNDAIAAMKQRLEEKGYTITSEVSASGEGVGSPQDQIAAQRFAAEDVDLAILAVGGTSAINFMSYAEQQGYRPDYLDFDYGEHTTDVAAGAFDADQYGDTFAMTVHRIGELAAGDELGDAAETCLENYAEYSGEPVEAEVPETGEYSNVLLTCDLAAILLEGLSVEGELTRETFVQRVESIEDLELAGAGTAGFGPDDHSGVDEVRTIRWDNGCTCWMNEGDPRPVSR